MTSCRDTDFARKTLTKLFKVRKGHFLVKILVRVMELVWVMFFYHPEQVYEVSLIYYDQLWRYRLCTQNFNQIF